MTLAVAIAGVIATAPALAQSEDAAAPSGPQGLLRWFDPSAAFLPVPYIDVNPNAGVTIGILPTKLITDDQSQIRKIIAPDLVYNPHFGVGATGRVLAYPSDETQWSVVGGAYEHLENQFDYEYETGRLRDETWTFDGSVVFGRTGTPRFYGIGNFTRESRETNFTLLQKYVQSVLGLNLTRALQLSWTLRARSMDVQPGTLSGIDTIESLFPAIPGLGVGHETLNRLALAYDSRNDPSVPTQGGKYVVYAGAAASHGILNSSLYRDAGVDVRQLWTPAPGNTIAVHGSLRYTPGGSDIPFWALASLGGDESLIGEQQPLRGYGAGRFYDRNSFSASIEYRDRVLSLDAVATHINVELTPFYEVGEVFASSRDSPVNHLHRVAGVGVRGIAAPFVVGYVDMGYGSEGAAVFTGINYPF
jgi:hypothetical protein